MVALSFQKPPCNGHFKNDQTMLNAVTESTFFTFFLQSEVKGQEQHYLKLFVIFLSETCSITKADQISMFFFQSSQLSPAQQILHAHLLLSPAARAVPAIQGNCPSGWVEYKYKCYFFQMNSSLVKSWDNANNYCKKMYNGSLASINNPETMALFITYIG